MLRNHKRNGLLEGMAQPEKGGEKQDSLQETMETIPAYFGYRHILKTAKNVILMEKPPVHMKMEHFLPADFENSKV